MKHLLPLFVLSALLIGCERQYEQNPDPNHTHADFAVWVDGEKVDFSDPKYMSGDEYHHQHLHLHDEIGEVVHRHKPGLSLKEFFDSLHFTFKSPLETWKMWVNGEEMEFDLNYVFEDMDQILLTNSAGSAQVLDQLEQMTDEACLFSRTCPWRGDPPAENCVADPAVPCVVPEEDL